MTTPRAQRAGEIFDEVLDEAYLRVQQATHGGNPAAIDAAKTSYYELLEDILRAERAEQQAAEAEDQAHAEVPR